MESQISTLREELQKQHGEQNIAIDRIRPNSQQPRQTISNESITAIARSLDKDGQITPVILIPAKKGKYTLWDGERRWRGAQRLRWESLRAVISPMPSDLHRKALLTFLHHEDLNPLDKAEAVVREIYIETNIPEDLVPSGVRALVRRLERQSQVHTIREILNESSEVQETRIAQLALSEEQKIILGVLLDLQINPASFAANDLLMLTLQDDLKLAIRELGLKGAHALALQKLSSERLALSPRKASRVRVDATNQVIARQLTVTKAKELVQSLLKQHNNKQSKVGSDRKLRSFIKSLDKLDLMSVDKEQLSQLKERLNLFMAELERQLSA